MPRLYDGTWHRKPSPTYKIYTMDEVLDILENGPTTDPICDFIADGRVTNMIIKSKYGPWKGLRQLCVYDDTGETWMVDGKNVLFVADDMSELRVIGTSYLVLYEKIDEV